MKTEFKALVDKVPKKKCTDFLFDHYETDCMLRIVLRNSTSHYAILKILSRIFRQRLKLICFCMMLVKVVSHSKLIVELDWRILQYFKKQKVNKGSIFSIFFLFFFIKISKIRIHLYNMGYIQFKNSHILLNLKYEKHGNHVLI